MGGGVPTRRVYWEDAETGRRGFSDGELPDGPLVEEISARDFYKREALSLECGWPTKHHAADDSACPCGCIFPDRASPWMHTPDPEVVAALDDAELLGLTRYFYHPESDSLFTTAGEDPASDGLVEEIDEDTYAAILARQADDEVLG